MYAFLSKVFGRKKDDKDASSSTQPVLGPGELLGGRFEAVSANVSPTSQFVELDPNINEAKDKEKDKDKDVGFSFFKGKWRPASPDVKPTRKLDILPHLSLNFQEPKTELATPNMELLFTTDQILSDADIGQRRLNPSEALILIQACSRAIVARGLETLGIMHPHWYAASHKIQRRVISHFIYLLNLENATSIPSPTSPLSAFEGEVNDTFSPHDIAAILRWGLRHVQIEGDSFGTDDTWYKTFLESEGAAGYPPKAFSDKLAPLLPTSHLQLLTATLEIFSSLAAHAEVNGTSGSKLCKLFGLWLLTAHRVEDKDDWKTFYARWEQTGRMLEHLFLSRIRDQSADQRMPIRLLELIHNYPYNQHLPSPTTDLSLLPHPPFTTRLHDALFVRIEIELPYGKRKPGSRLHPFSLLADAFSTKVEGEFADLWAKMANASNNGDSSFLSNIFTDDTISYLSLVPDEPSGQEVKSPTFNLASTSVSPNKPTFSVDDADKSTAFVPGHHKSSSEFSPMAPLSPLNNGIGSDWAQFSASGFLEVNPNIVPLASTLLDTDIEKTTPPEADTSLSRKSSKRSKAASPSSPRKSIDLHRPTSPEAKLEGIIDEQKNIIKASQPRIIQIDEAFIDFWSDSLLDPISADWPTFVICKFKSSLVPELTIQEGQQQQQEQRTIQWLLLEQVYSIRTPPPVTPIVVVRPRPRSPISPSPSLKQRFSFWSVSRSASNSSATSQKGKKKEQEYRVGEMGELVEEEPKHEGKEELVGRARSPIFRTRRSLDVAPKSAEVTRKSVVVKPAEEAKIDEEITSGVAAGVATGIVVASAAVVITNTAAQPNLVEAVTTTTTTKAKVDHLVDVPAVSTPRVAATETVVLSSEPTRKQDDVLLSTTTATVDPDVDSSTLEVKAETEPLESDNIVVEGTAIEPGEIVTEDRDEVEPSPATTQVADVAPITTRAITEVGETVGVLEQTDVQQAPVVVPLVSEVVIPEPEPEAEAPAKHDLTSKAEESPAAFPSEVTPAALEAKAETEPVEAPAKHDLELTTTEDPPAIITPEQSETIQSKTTEAEHMLSPVEDKTDIADDKTSDIMIRPVEEAKFDEETAGVAAVAIGVAVASAAAAVVITDELPTTQPSVVEAVTTEDHSADIPAIEAVSTQVEATETVVPSPEPTVEQDDVPLSTTVEPDVVSSSLEAKAEMEPLEADNLVVEGTATEPEVIVEEQTEDHAEIEASPTTHAVPVSVTDVAPITTEAITEEGETVGVLEQTEVQQAPIVAPFVSEIVIPEPEAEEPAKHDIESKAEESHAVFTPEQSETIESKATEAEHMSSPVEDKTDIADSKTSDIIEHAEEGKGDEETAGVAALATGVAVAGAAVVISNESPTAQPSLVEEVTTEDHSADIPAIEAVSTQVEAIETVVPSPEPTAEHHDDVPLSTTVEPDVVSSSLEAKAETELLEAENLGVERTAIEPEVIVEEQTEDRAEIETSPATAQVVPASVADVAPITTETVTGEGETVDVLEQTDIQQAPIVVPLVSEVVIPEPEPEVEEPAKHDIETKAEESPAVSTPEQSETIESSATEAEHMSSPVEDKSEVADSKTSDEETAGVAAVAAGIAVAGAAVVISNELPTAQPNLVEEVTTEDHSADIPAIEAVSTQVDATEIVVPLPEPTVEDVPLSTTVGPDVVSSLEVNTETEPIESDNIVVERTAIEPEVIVEEQTKDHAEIEASPATAQVVPASVADVAPITTEAITGEGETVSVLEQTDVQQAPIVTPVVSEVVIPEPEPEAEAPAKHDIESKAEESPAVFTPEQPETIESSATKAEHMSSPMEDKSDVADSKTSDEETAGVGAVAAGIAVAGAAVVISNELPTAQPSLVEEVTTEDHSADIPAIEAVSTQVEAIETVVPSPEPTVEHDVPLSTTVEPDVVSSLEAKVETEPLEPENLVVEGTAIEPEVIVEEQTEDRAEIEASPATAQAVPASVADVAPITMETITGEGETVSVLEQTDVQQTPIVVPLVSEVVIPEPEPETEAPAKHDLESKAEESPVVFASEPETSNPIEEIPATIDHSLLAESGSLDDENGVNRSEIIEPRATEAEHMFSPVEDKTNVADDKTTDSAPILAAAEQLPEITSQEVFQPQPTEVPVTEDVLDKENQDEIITSSAKLEDGHGTAENNEEREFVVKEAKHDFDPEPAVLPDVNKSLEHEVETEADEPPLSTSAEQGLPTSIEHELDTAHSDELAVVAGDSSKVVLNADVTGDIDLQSEPQQETLTVLSPSAQETEVDVVSGSKDALTAVVAHEVDTEVEAETHATDAANTTNDIAAAESPETEQPVMPTTEGDSTKHVNEAAIVAVGLATVEHFSNTDKVVPEVTHEATPEAGNDSVERETTLNLEPPQREHEVDLNVPETEGTLPDIDPTPVPLPLEPENSHIQTELVAECGIEATPTATTNSFPIDTEVQPDPSLGETAPNAQKDIEEAQTQVGDTSDIKDEPIPETDIAQHIEAADAESVLEDVPASSTNESQNTVRLEPEIDFVAPAEEEPSAITQVAAEDLLPKIESEGAISGTPDETIPIPDDVTASVANVEDQIIAPVDIESEHAAVVQVSSTDELTEAILPTNAEESPENLTPLVEPPHKSSDDEVVESHVVPEVDVHVPETHVFGEAALVSIMAAASAESDLGRGAVENVAVPSQELPVDAEPKEPVTHEEATPEVHVPITAETEPEPHSTNPTSEDKVSTLEAEEEYALPSSESLEAANIELDDNISPAAVEPGPEVVAPVLETSELQAQHSVGETTEEVHFVGAAGETESIVPNEETTVDPVKGHLEIQEAGESDLTAEIEPKIIPGIIEESPVQIEGDRPVLAVPQDDNTLSREVHTEPLDTELEDPATVVGLDTSFPVVSTPAIAVAAQSPEVQEDRLDTTVTSEVEPNLPSHEIKTESTSSIKEGDAVQESSPSKSNVDIDVQPEAQVLEAETHEADAATTMNDTAAAEFSETEQPVVPTIEGDSTKHANEAAIVAVGLATVEDFSSTDKVVPEVAHEATPEAGNESVESGTTFKVEPPQREHEVHVTVPETESALPDIHSNLRYDATPVLEPGISLTETELVAEHQVETTSTAITNSVPIDVEVQPDPTSSETAPNTQKDIEVQTQVDETANIKDVPISDSDTTQHIEATDIESALEDVLASSTKESHNTVQLEPEDDFVAPAEEEPSAITHVAVEDLLPEIESEAIPIPEDVTASVANVEDQIIGSVDVRSEHAAVVETSSTDEPAEVILLPNVEENHETLTPLVEPSHKGSDDEIVESHVVSEADVHVPETQVFGEAALVSMAVVPVESDLGREAAEIMSVSSQEPPLNAEPKEPVTHEEAAPEVHVPITAEAEPEPRPTNSSTSEDKVSTLEVEGQHVLPSPERPVLGTFELQAQHSVEETTEEVHIVEAASETEIIVPNEESTVEPVKAHLDIQEAGASDSTTEVEPQTVPEESSAQIEEDRPVLATLQDDTTLSKEVHAGPLDAELAPIEDPAMVAGSEPDASYSIPEVHTPAIDRDIAVTTQVQEDQLDTAVIPKAEPDLPSHEIKTEGSSSINKGDAVNNLEPEVETEAIAEPLPSLIEQDLPTTIEPELDTPHSDEPAVIAEGSSKVALNTDATGGIELQSELQQETLTALSPSAQETGVDVISSSKDALTAVPAREVETEVEVETHGTDAATSTNDLQVAAAESPDTELPVMPATEDDSIKHVNDDVILAVGLASAEDFSSMDKEAPEVNHEATPKAESHSVESETTLNIEPPQREHEVDVTVPETEGTLPDIHLSLRNDTPVPLPLEPENSTFQTELVAERQVEITSTTTTNSVPIDVEVQPDPSSSETAADAQRNIEIQTVVDTSDIKDEPISESDIAQHIEAADSESVLEGVPASTTKESQNTVQLEPDVFIAPAEEEPTITQVATENLLPKIESEGPISQTPGDTIPILEDATVAVANVEDRTIAPVDVGSQHAAVVETSSTDKVAEVILPPNVEESPENLIPLVEPSYKGSDESHVVPGVDVHVPETHVFGEAALVSILAAESDLGREAVENISVPSQELPANAEPEESVTHEEATPEVNVPFTAETEPEPCSTYSTSEDKVSSLEVEEQHVLLSPESREAANIELNDDNISPAAVEPGPEVVAAVVAPALGTFELQAQHSVEETTEDVHIVSNEESTVDPVKGQLELQEAGESDLTAEVEPKIIPAIMESPAQIEEEKPVLAAPQDDTILSKEVHAESLDTELVPIPIEHPAVVESEPNALHMNIQEEAGVSPVEFEAIDNTSTAELPVAEIATVVSELPTEVPEEPQIKNDSIAQAEDLALLTDDLAQEEAIVPITEVKDTVESSTDELSAPDTPLVISGPATVVPEEPQTESDSIAKTEEELAVPPPPTINPVPEADVSLVEFEVVDNPSTDQPTVAEIAPVVSELPTEVPEELQIENGSIAQADLAPQTDDLSQEEAVVPITEVKETVESSTDEPSVADTLLVSSEPAKVVPEEPQAENDSIAQAEEDLAVPPPPTINPVPEADVSLVEFEVVDNLSTAPPTVAEIAPVVSELPTEVPEELQIENGSIAQAEDLAPETDDLSQEETVVPIVEVKETVESPTDEPSVADTLLVSFEPAKVVLEEPQTEKNDSIAKTEEELAVPPPPTVNPVQEVADVSLVESEEAVENPSTTQPPVAEIAPVVSELPTEVPEEPQIENDSIAQAEDLAPPTETDTLTQEETVVPIVEVKETLGSSTGEPSVADTLLASSEPATVALEEPQTENDIIAQAEDLVDPPPDTLLISSEPIVVPEETKNDSVAQAEKDLVDPPGTLLASSEPAIVLEEPQTENNSIAQAEEDLVDPPPLTDDPVQEEANATHVTFEEAVENSSAAQPPVAEISPVVSELPTEVPEELQIENDSTAQAEDLAPPSDNLAQEEAVGPIAEFKAVESSSADEPSVTDTPLAILSEPAIVEHEAVQIKNGGIPQAEEGLVDPPPTDDSVQEGANATLVELKEAVENSSIAQPPVAEIAPVVSELPTEVTPTEKDLVDPLPTDDPVQENVEEAVESFSTAEPPVAEAVSVASGPPTEAYWEFSLISDGVALAGDGLIDPPSLQNVETEHIGEHTEGQGKAAILETTAVDDLEVDQAALGKVEMQSFDETETHVLNGNGHSTQETTGTIGLEASSVNLATNIQADPKVIEPTHPSHISPATLEAPSIID